MSTSHEGQHSARHPTFMQYVLVATILFAVTIVEFTLIYHKFGISDDLGAAKIPLLVVLSGFKFAVVIMFYMHLKFDSRLFSGIFLAGLGLAFAVGLALLGLFVALKGSPREFAEANALPYVEEAAGSVPHTIVEEKAAKATAEVGGARNLKIGVVGDALQFDTPSFTASAGAEVVLTFANVSTVLQHNWTLVKNETKDKVATRGTAAGPANGWLQPADAEVIANVKLLNPGETGRVSFTAPPAGMYQFVCTFPGHNFTMFGNFEVTP